MYAADAVLAVLNLLERVERRSSAACCGRAPACTPHTVTRGCQSTRRETRVSGLGHMNEQSRRTPQPRSYGVRDEYLDFADGIKCVIERRIERDCVCVAEVEQMVDADILILVVERWLPQLNLVFPQQLLEARPELRVGAPRRPRRIHGKGGGWWWWWRENYM